MFLVLFYQKHIFLNFLVDALQRTAKTENSAITTLQTVFFNLSSLVHAYNREQILLTRI